MSKHFAVSLLVFTLLLLSACTAAEFFIKRAVNGFEQDISKELQSLADFTAEQELDIEALADATDSWMRTERLSSVQSLILILATDVEQLGQIEPSNWYSVANFLSAGLAISQSPDLIKRYAILAASLTEQQVDQVVKSFNDELDESLKKREDRTIERQNERIVDGLKWVFRAVEQPLTPQQRDYAKDFLSARRVDFDYQRQNKIKETDQLSGIVLNAQSLGADEVSRQLHLFFQQIENSKSVPSEEDWQYNVDLFLQLINHFVAELNTQERIDMAMSLREYEQIFDELSKS